MDERQIKRLLFIVAFSIVTIIFFKTILTRSYTSMNKAAELKKRAAPVKPEPAQTMQPASIGTFAASGVRETSTMATQSAPVETSLIEEAGK